ncbi:hypothetical protein AAG570_004546 [Ranatra chinensis]|uniref:Uncharacterized protein n=1 Tax=Ranatra chinensis TaxID=642074 RepID=A0ABD0Y160_9HEMI
MPQRNRHRQLPEQYAHQQDGRPAAVHRGARDPLAACLDADGTYICTAYNSRCYIIQKFEPSANVKDDTWPVLSSSSLLAWALDSSHRPLRGHYRLTALRFTGGPPRAAGADSWLSHMVAP